MQCLFLSPDRHTSHIFREQLTYQVTYWFAQDHNQQPELLYIRVVQTMLSIHTNCCRRGGKNIAVKLQHLAIPKVRVVYCINTRTVPQHPMECHCYPLLRYPIIARNGLIRGPCRLPDQSMESSHGTLSSSSVLELLFNASHLKRSMECRTYS